MNVICSIICPCYFWTVCTGHVLLQLTTLMSHGGAKSFLVMSYVVVCGVNALSRAWGFPCNCCVPSFQHLTCCPCSHVRCRSRWGSTGGGVITSVTTWRRLHIRIHLTCCRCSHVRCKCSLKFNRVRVITDPGEPSKSGISQRSKYRNSDSWLSLEESSVMAV
jgi:hypothetical protein